MDIPGRHIPRYPGPFPRRHWLRRLWHNFLAPWLFVLAMLGWGCMAMEILAFAFRLANRFLLDNMLHL